MRHLSRAARVPSSWYERALLVLSLCALLGGFLLVWAASLTIPDIETLHDRKIVQSAKIYDRTGKILLDDLGDDVTRTLVPFEDISQNIKNATIAIEDDQFYTHRGIRVMSIIRSLVYNALYVGYTQGGSTITQQVVKNSILTQDKTIARKLKEWVLAVKLDASLPKDKILEIYLNENPYGGSLYGIEEASETFFGKPAKDVTLAEAAYLAAIPQAPTYYSPYGNHKDKLDERKNLVLTRMHTLGMITDNEFESAKSEKVVFVLTKKGGIRAPHFVFFVRDELERQYGPAALEENGWRVITTLDADLQGKAEEIVKSHALENEKRFNAKNAALVAIDPKTGDVLTMVGSRDYFDTNIDGNFNIALAHRQPGSSFKPFVYAAAFLKGYTPDTVLFDSPTQFSTVCPVESTKDESPCYYPENYDGKYRGPMTIREALAQSINIPAIKALYLVGLTDALRVARSLGITTLLGPEQYGLTLVLGGGEVSLLEMVSAYSVLADEGVRNPYRAILQIQDKNGQTIHTFDTTPTQAIDQNAALMISDILSDDAARIPEFGVNSALNVSGHHVASKTGTTNDFKDTWILGYSTSLAAGAWAGNNDNTPIDKKIAGFVVAPLWNEFMQYALTKYPEQPFPDYTKPATTKPVLSGIWQGFDPIITDINGNPVSQDYTGQTRTKITSNVHSILYSVNKSDPLGPPPTNPANDPQFERWEYGVRRWAQANGYIDGTVLYINN